MSQTLPDLIPRQALFGNPTRTNGQISPDGQWLSWIAPRDGVMNVWIAPVGAPDQGRAVTTETVRPIPVHFWAADSRSVLFVNDRGGDENFLLYGVDVDSGEQRALTPFDKTMVMVIGTSRDVKDRILIGLNNRDQRWHDVHDLNVNTGEMRLVLQNDGYGGFVADERLNLRLAHKPTADGGAEYHRVTDGVVEAEAFATVGFEDSQTTAPVGFTRDGRTIYWIDSRDRDTSALVGQHWQTGATRVIAQSDKADVGGIMTNPLTNEVEAYSINYLRKEWTATDPDIGADLAFLKDELKGDITVTSRTDADDKWIVTVDPVTAPTAAHVFDRKARTLTLLYTGRPELEGATLASMRPLELKSRDGLTMVSYLTLPPGSDSDDDGIPDHPLPTVLLVHGGPWARDAYGSNTYHQWLANRGYAVLSVNFRGSTGFGKSFTAAGDGAWGTAMHDDLLDAVSWAVEHKVSDPAKVAIMGGSYGGYATLAGLAFTPDAFACGVDIVGPSNLATLLSTIPPYWESFKRQMFRRMADPGTEDGRRWLAERSPLNRAGAISKPLLIGQGANDPRVRQAESDQIVAAMQARNIPVTYVLFPDEGHGFARPENNIAFNAVAEEFLSASLGGRAEPIGEALVPSSIQVPHGAEFAPGLAEALAVRPTT